jgi:hypothetical protein
VCGGKKEESRVFVCDLLGKKVKKREEGKDGVSVYWWEQKGKGMKEERYEWGREGNRRGREWKEKEMEGDMNGRSGRMK